MEKWGEASVSNPETQRFYFQFRKYSDLPPEQGVAVTSPKFLYKNLEWEVAVSQQIAGLCIKLSLCNVTDLACETEFKFNYNEKEHKVGKLIFHSSDKDYEFILDGNFINRRLNFQLEFSPANHEGTLTRKQEFKRAFEKDSLIFVSVLLTKDPVELNFEVIASRDQSRISVNAKNIAKRVPSIKDLVKEGGPLEVDLNNEGLKVLLLHIVIGTLTFPNEDVLTKSDWEDLLITSAKFKLNYLRDYAGVALADDRFVTKENVGELLQLVYKHGAVKAMAILSEFRQANLDDCIVLYRF